MDKFAVTPSAQGEGLGAALWHYVRARFPTLYWRARPNNPINPWYLRQADAHIRKDDWLVFGIGFDSLEELDKAASRCTTLPESWVPTSTQQGQKQ
jgi:acetylglutamate synthase